MMSGGLHLIIKQSCDFCPALQTDVPLDSQTIDTKTNSVSLEADIENVAYFFIWLTPREWKQPPF